jgi:hypothetical protein
MLWSQRSLSTSRCRAFQSAPGTSQPGLPGQRIVLYAKECCDDALIGECPGQLTVSAAKPNHSKYSPGFLQALPPILFSSTHRAATAARDERDTNMTSTSEATFMRLRLRLVLQPAWVRFLVGAGIGGAVFAPVGIEFVFGSPSQSIWKTMIFALFFALVFGVVLTSNRGMHAALTEAVAELDQTERFQAVAAVTHGIMPADQRVQYAAVRLGRAYLGGKSPEQLKREERQTWVTLVLVVVTDIGVAVENFNAHDLCAGLCLLVLMLLAAVVLLLRLLSKRRTQRNIGLACQPSCNR